VGVARGRQVKITSRLVRIRSTLTASNRSAIQPPPTERDEPKRRHVWVDCSGGFRRPGLVIAWRRIADGWEAYVAILRDDSVLVTWEKASDLHPVRDEGWSKAHDRSF
jgi:hypothetical protein